MQEREEDLADQRHEPLLRIFHIILLFLAAMTPAAETG